MDRNQQLNGSKKLKRKKTCGCCFSFSTRYEDDDSLTKEHNPHCAGDFNSGTVVREEPQHSGSLLSATSDLHSTSHLSIIIRNDVSVHQQSAQSTYDRSSSSDRRDRFHPKTVVREQSQHSGSLPSATSDLHSTSHPSIIKRNDVSVHQRSAQSTYDRSSSSDRRSDKTKSESPGTLPSEVPEKPRFAASVAKFGFQPSFQLPLESRARVVKNNHFIGGNIVWTGHTLNTFKMVAVLHLDTPMSGASDGSFEGQRLVNRSERDRYLMCDVNDVESLSFIKEGDYGYVKYGPNDLTKRGGFLRNHYNNSYELHPLDTTYLPDSQHNYSRIQDFFLITVPPPISDEQSEKYGPICLEMFQYCVGRNKGIQGKNNSCYLDTLLFSLFAFSDELDKTLFDDKTYNDVRNHLYNSIVAPLRASHFVSYTNIEYLRSIIAKKTDNPKFETHTRDIPECIDALCGKLLQVPLPALLGTGNDFVPTFAIETWPPPDRNVGTSQWLLEYSAVLMDFRFKEVPNYFFLQFPRQDGQSRHVIPSLELDIHSLLHQSHKICFSCQRNAALQFLERFEEDGLNGTFFCYSCAEELHLDPQKARKLPKAKVLDGEESESKMVLTAVICIERSHYNCFARCRPDRWVFFDSMSDQEELLDPFAGTLECFNIPLIREVLDFSDIVNNAHSHFEKYGNIEEFVRTLPDYLQRIFNCTYSALYSSRLE